jgi:hypothetical protein
LSQPGAWTSEAEDDDFVPHYPSIHPERVILSETLHRLAADPVERDRYVADPKAYSASVDGLNDAERAALETLDQPAMIALGMHPFVPHSFVRVLERAGLREAPAPGKP